MCSNYQRAVTHLVQPQVKEFKPLRGLFSGEGKMEHDIDR